MRFAKLIYSFTTIATSYLAFKFFSKKSPALTEEKVNKYQEDFSRLITELKDINIINRTFKIEIKPTILSSLKKLSAQDLTNLKNKIEPLITQAKLLLSEIEELRVNTQVNPELLNQNIAKYQNDLRLFSEILKNIKKLSNTEHNNYVTDNVNFF